MQRLFVDSQHSDMLAREGLYSFGSFYHNKLPGVSLNEEQQRVTKRVTIDGCIFYFKRVFRSSLGKSLEPLLKLRAPHHYCWREMQELRHLQEAGFSVATVAAAGEHTRRGVPVASFLLTREVPGLSLTQLLEDSDAAGREKLFAQFGAYTAGLHLAGFYTPVRTKDVICNDNSKHWSLIDRETRHPGAQPFTPRRAREALIRTFHRENRHTPVWDTAARKAFCEKYCNSVAPRWSICSTDLQNIIGKTTA